ncbi:hypothetical protein V5P93_004543 [Actinokineospora auranticolor]|uniref:hypothetical protein n=1 Tax=Actinokineospora auranticolor TaxID=155976 RepID=UPI000CEBB39E|nr:hypothetical protein [Actinokineospora auranticolor]
METKTRVWFGALAVVLLPVAAAVVWLVWWFGLVTAGYGGAAGTLVVDECGAIQIQHGVFRYDCAGAFVPEGTEAAEGTASLVGIGTEYHRDDRVPVRRDGDTAHTASKAKLVVGLGMACALGAGFATTAGYLAVAVIRRDSGADLASGFKLGGKVACLLVVLPFAAGLVLAVI